MTIFNIFLNYSYASILFSNISFCLHFTCMSVCQHVYVCTMYIQCFQRPEEGVKSPVPEATNDCEL